MHVCIFVFFCAFFGYRVLVFVVVIFFLLKGGLDLRKEGINPGTNARYPKPLLLLLPIYWYEDFHQWSARLKI